MAKGAKPAKDRPNLAQRSVAEPPLVPRNKALVFISHDSRDSDLAEAFGNLLTDASGGFLKSFRSSDRKGTAGIEFGAEWYTAIMAMLDDATDVVALLTQHSIDRPWILYEAGVAKGKLNTTVFGVALGVPLEHVSTGPFAQFQNSSDDEDSLTKLVLQLIRRNPDASPREEAVRRQVLAFRENVSTLVKTRKGPALTAAAKVDETAVAKLFEEVKVMFSTLPERLEDKLRESVRRKGSLRRRLHPMMLEEFLFHPALRGSPGGRATGWLMFISSFRDDLPWLYDIGLEMYRALCSEDRATIETARRNLKAAIEMTMHSRVMRHQMMDDDPESHMVLRHLPEMVDHYFESVIADRPDKRKAKPKGQSGKEGSS